MTAKTAKAPTKKPKTTKVAKVAKKPAVKAASVAKSEASAKPIKKVDDKRSLRLWNVRLGIVLLLLAIAVVVAGDSSSVPLTMQYLSKDALASDAASQEVLAPAIRHLADINISWLVAKFLAVFGVFYLLYATLLRKHYETWLESGVNKLRWLGFGLGTGTMAVAVAMLSGISDLGYLILIFSSLVILGVLSTIVELLGPGRRLRKYIIITALFTAALPVAVIAMTLAGVLMYDGTLPVFMYYIYGSMSLMSVAMALACIFRLRRRGKWANTYFAERMFMILGFLASSILALQIFAGALLS